MAVQVINLPAQPAALGWADLGQSLSQAAEGYVSEQDKRKARQQQLEDEARRRTQALEDVASERGYQTTRDASNRTADLQDFSARSQIQAQLAKLSQSGELWDKLTTALKDEVGLDPQYIGVNPNDPDTQKTNPAGVAAVKAAIEKSKQTFDEKTHLSLYETFMDQLANGELDPSEIDDPKARNAALVKTIARKKAGLAASQAQQANTTAYVNQLYAQHQDTLARLKDAEADAAFDPSLATPNPEDVRKAAIDAALQANKNLTKNDLNEKLIAAQMPAATQKAIEELRYAQQMKLQAAKQIIPALTRQVAQEESALAAYGQGITPAVVSGGVGASSPTPTPTRTAPYPDARAAAIAALAGKGPPAGATGAPPPAQTLQQPRPVGAAPSPTPAALQPLPGTGPVIQAENQRRAQAAQAASAGKWQTNLANPYDDTLDKIADVQNGIKILSDPNYAKGYDWSQAPGSRVPFTPQQRAQALSDLQAQMAALQTQLQQRKRKMLGVPDNAILGMPATGAATGVPAVSDSNGAMPTPPPAANWLAPPGTMQAAGSSVM